MMNKIVKHCPCVSMAASYFLESPTSKHFICMGLTHLGKNFFENSYSLKKITAFIPNSKKWPRHILSLNWKIYFPLSLIWFLLLIQYGVHRTMHFMTVNSQPVLSVFKWNSSNCEKSFKLNSIVGYDPWFCASRFHQQNYNSTIHGQLFTISML